jgi:SAM-dependent methyltransferase
MLNRSEHPSHTKAHAIPTHEGQRGLALEARHERTLIHQRTLVPIPEALKRWLASSYSQHLVDPIVYPSGSLELYSRAIPLKERVQAFFERTREPVEILDVGCGDGKALLEIGQHFGETVSVRGLSLAEISLIAEDRAIRLPVEFLPDEHRCRFDLIVCRHALSIFLCPHIALKAMAYSLRSGGEAWILGSPSVGSRAKDTALTYLLEHSASVVKSWEPFDALIEELIKAQHVAFNQHLTAIERPSRPFNIQQMKETYKSVYEDPFGVHLRVWLQAITELRREGFTIEFQEPSHYGSSPRIVRNAFL